MITNFTTDAKSAIKADRSSAISETGIYLGKIKQADTYETMGGAQMVRLWFASLEGQECFTSFCITKRDGTEAWGMSLLHSIFVVTNVQGAAAIPAQVRKPSGDVIDGFRLRALEEKFIGVALPRENYTYEGNGELVPTYNMNLVRCFRPDTMQTASEVIQNAEPKRIDALAKTLADKNRDQTVQRAPAPVPHPATQNAIDDFDEDIPI